MSDAPSDAKAILTQLQQRMIPDGDLNEFCVALEALTQPNVLSSQASRPAQQMVELLHAMMAATQPMDATAAMMQSKLGSMVERFPDAALQGFKDAFGLYKDAMFAPLIAAVEEAIPAFKTEIAARGGIGVRDENLGITR